MVNSAVILPVGSVTSNVGSEQVTLALVPALFSAYIVKYRGLPGGFSFCRHKIMYHLKSDQYYKIFNSEIFGKVFFCET